MTRPATCFIRRPAGLPTRPCADGGRRRPACAINRTPPSRCPDRNLVFNSCIFLSLSRAHCKVSTPDNPSKTRQPCRSASVASARRHGGALRWSLSSPSTRTRRLSSATRKKPLSMSWQPRTLPSRRHRMKGRTFSACRAGRTVAFQSPSCRGPMGMCTCRLLPGRRARTATHLLSLDMTDTGQAETSRNAHSRHLL